MSLATLALAFLAGALTVLSPCVLPLLPIVLASAAGGRRFGPLALAAGLATSFVAVGLFLATAGFALGIDDRAFRTFGAVAMIAVGALLTVPALQTRLAAAGAPLARWADARIAGIGGGEGTGPLGQFLIGLLLGAVWSPCVGPTLGAASVLAAQGEALGEVALTMLLFGFGAAAPLVAIGLASREVLTRWRSRLLHGGRALKMAMGAVFLVLGLAVLTGLDKRIETALVELSPDWLTALTTRF
ncbi:MAG: cytochrome c biogenesis CcdA family protein [Bauldia sp.]